MYRGVFASPFEYDISLSYEKLTRVKEKAGIPLTDFDIQNIERLRKLDELGGVRKPLTQKEFESLLKKLSLKS